jgi:hypothetical protein
MRWIVEPSLKLRFLCIIPVIIFALLHYPQNNVIVRPGVVVEEPKAKKKSLKQLQLLEAGSQRSPLGTVVPLPFYFNALK